MCSVSNAQQRKIMNICIYINDKNNELTSIRRMEQAEKMLTSQTDSLKIRSSPIKLTQQQDV